MTDTLNSHAVTSPEVATAAAHFLTPVVHGLISLAVNGKQAHWHVRGENFIGVHEFLDVVVEHAGAWADTAAERIVALGLPIDARLETVAKKADTPELTSGFRQSADTITEVIQLIDVVLARLTEAIDGLAEIDPASQDVAIEIRRGLDKDRWFLYSHISVS